MLYSILGQNCDKYIINLFKFGIIIEGNSYALNLNTKLGKVQYIIERGIYYILGNTYYI